MSNYLSSKRTLPFKIQVTFLCSLVICTLLISLQPTRARNYVQPPRSASSTSGIATVLATEPDITLTPSDNKNLVMRNVQWWQPDPQGNPAPNSQLRFVVKTVAKSGGHNHDDASRPSVRISFSTSDQTGAVDTGFVSTGSSGVLNVIYLSPKIAGESQLSVTGINPMGENTGTATQNVHVKIPGFVELTGGGIAKNYELKPPEPEHPGSYFGTPAMVQALSNLADEYAAEHNGDKLPCNDMSIEWGGIFDLKGDWKSPHREHANGVDVDIRTRLIAPDRRHSLLQMANRLGFNVLIHDGTVLGDHPHWHLRYLHGPDCEVYKRGKCNLKALVPALEKQVSTAESAPPSLHVNVQVSEEPVTGLFKYNYTFTNDASSPSEVSAVQLLVNRSVVLDVKTPQGWTSKMWSDGAALAFAATDIGTLPPGFVDDGLLVPSPFQIKPGESLSGFSFLSPDPPAQIEILAQGFQQLPVLEDSDTGGLAVNSFKGTVQGPVGANLPNRITDTAFYVRQHYQDFLSRDPDISGFQFWTSEIKQCASNQQCIEVKRINVSAAFFLSIEFQETGYLVYRMYKAAFGNLPGTPVPLRREELVPDTRRIGKGVIVGVGDWQQRLDANKNAYAREFVASSRFISAFPPGLTATQFVDKLDQNAGGVLSAAERLNLINQLTNPSDTQQRAAVLRKIAENVNFSRREFNKAFVLMQYFGYLLRNPNDAPDTNYDGFNFWLSKLNQFNGNFVQAEMVKAFITSIEYVERFAP